MDDLNSAARSQAKKTASGVEFRAEQIITAGDASACYAKDFIVSLAMIPDDEAFDIRLKLKSKFGRDFNTKEFDARLKRERANLTPAAPMVPWREKLICGEMGPKALLANAMAAIRHAPEWRGVIAFDEFALRVVKLKPPPWEVIRKNWVQDVWGDTDSSRTAEWLQHQGILVNSKVANEACVTVSRESGFHPVRDYLNGLSWDKQPRVDNWLFEYLQVQEPAELLEKGMEDKLKSFRNYIQAIGRCWLIAAVKRIFEPGCQSDYALIFEGKQGKGKSQALKALAGPWFTDNVQNVTNKDASMTIAGVWIVEFAEFDKHTRSEDADMKAFLTRQSDRFRPPYGYNVQEVPRQCVFAGSINPASWMKDETGGRRYWSVRCGKVKVEDLHRMRDEIWAEAMYMYKSGTKSYLEGKGLVEEALNQQQDRHEGDAWDSIVAEWLVGPTAHHDSEGRRLQPFTSGLDSVSVSDILMHAIKKPADKWTQPDQTRIAKILTRFGWERYRLTYGTRPWMYRPEVVEDDKENG